jgi:hypothetical protein
MLVVSLMSREVLTGFQIHRHYTAVATVEWNFSHSTCAAQLHCSTPASNRATVPHKCATHSIGAAQLQFVTAMLRYF